MFHLQKHKKIKPENKSEGIVYRLVYPFFRIDEVIIKFDKLIFTAF